MNILVAHFADTVSYPPVISLVKNLLHHNHHVYLVAMDVKNLPKSILSHPNFQCTDIPYVGIDNIFLSLRKKIVLSKAKRIIQQRIGDYDVIWTTTATTVRRLGDVVLQRKHVMQLMELIKFFPMYPRFRFLWWWRFPIEKYAQQAYRVVLPEINRAYILKTWWNLPQMPIVLPNKPYDTQFEQINNSNALSKMQADMRYKLLYSGVVGDDRSLEPFMKAVQELGDGYVLYILAKIPNSYKEKFQMLLKKYSSVEYLGYYKAPQHLNFFPFADIGLMPYQSNGGTKNGTIISELNALYCAPNKIYEYARFGIPMLGTDVPGLRETFEKYNIGVSCRNLEVEEIKNKILYLQKNHDAMCAKCKDFYDAVDLDEIVESIIN